MSGRAFRRTWADDEAKAFRGAWTDDETDTESTRYALPAMGRLGLA